MPPLAGVGPKRAAEMLRTQVLTLKNLSGAGGDADSRLGSYHRWTTDATRMFSSIFPLDQVEQLVMTHRHDVLVARQTGYNQPLIHGLIDGEINDRTAVFAELAAQFESLEVRREDLGTYLLVVDTNIFVQHQKPFFNMDWMRELGSAHTVSLLIPMTAVRELDKMKRAPSTWKVDDGKETVRSRARTTLRWMRDKFRDPTTVVKLVSDVTVELLLDPVGHRRIDDPDTEIIDRSLVAQASTGHDVGVVTADASMQFSAAVAGLEVFHLAAPADTDA